MLLKARWVVPVSSPPIENGAVVVEGDRIAFVGGESALRQRPDLDLGDATLLPGLVNAHCHLQFSSRISPQPPLNLRGGDPEVPPLKLRGGEGGIFTEWVREMGRGGATGRIAPTEAINRLLHTGTTTVADHCNPETPRFDTPFRRITFWEVLGADKERAEASLKKAIERAEQEGGFATPHSLYGVHREILETTIRRVVRGKVSADGLARRQNLSEATGPALSLHFLESSDEDRFLRTGTGPLADYVREHGGEVSPPKSPLSLIPPGTLLVHGNYLTSEEIAALRRLNTSVIHCPGSHRFFGHRRFPLEDLKRAGVSIALGTDSLASNNDLSMLREMRLLKESYPELDEAVILKMATLEGARALGMEDEIGSIEVGKKADLIAVRGPVLQAEEACFVMIDGKVLKCVSA